jgi:hypothetical protein
MMPWEKNDRATWGEVLLVAVALIPVIAIFWALSK